jgi:hypothetical protein
MPSHPFQRRGPVLGQADAADEAGFVFHPEDASVIHARQGPSFRRLKAAMGRLGGAERSERRAAMSGQPLEIEVQQGKGSGQMLRRQPRPAREAAENP